MPGRAIQQIFEYKGHDHAFATDDIVEAPTIEEFEVPDADTGELESPAAEPSTRCAEGQKLHRSLGHPTRKELVRLRQNKRASNALVKAALEHECPLCELHQRPAGVPVSSMPRNTTFNQRVQADTQWIQIPGQRQPVLMISDCTTRLLAGRHLRGGERTEEFIKQLERAWTRNFGPMEVVQVDEHRAGSSDQMREWCTEQVIQVFGGQPHHCC
jgi:hypothetical protein